MDTRRQYPGSTSVSVIDGGPFLGNWLGSFQMTRWELAGWLFACFRV